MANPSTAHEPSMEEILASIRQIISEDGDAPPPLGEQALDADEPEDGETPSAPPAGEIAEPLHAAPAETGSARTEPAQERNSETIMKTPVPSASPNFATPAARAPEPPTPAAAPRPASFQNAGPAQNGGQPQNSRTSQDDLSLLSQRSDAAVSGSFSALAHTILAQNARTLEDLIAEMLRPMLKEWLDHNLPPLVERLVREEIERVSRGRR
jgi:cell pole-organizing protein PopZ